jgi:hypothetical protein
MNLVVHLVFGGLAGRPTGSREPIYPSFAEPGLVMSQRLEAIYRHLESGVLGAPIPAAATARSVVSTSPAACAAFVFSRHNVFKHVILAEPKRLGLPQHVVECAVTARAITFVAKLWFGLVNEEHFESGKQKGGPLGAAP